MRLILLRFALILSLGFIMLPVNASAAEKSYYSPIINIDVDNSRTSRFRLSGPSFG